VKISDGITSETAAAMMLKGMTVCYLIKRTYKVKSGDTVLFHAAAGGVGLIACQWLKALGVTMIGTAGSDEKCELAKAHGAHYCINYKKEDFVARVKEITGGKGVPVVYDSVGKDTFDKSLECLSMFGMMVTFGNSSGPVPPVNLAAQLKGHLFTTRPSLGPYTASRQDLLAPKQGEAFEHPAGWDRLHDLQNLSHGRLRIHDGDLAAAGLDRLAGADEAADAGAAEVVELAEVEHETRALRVREHAIQRLVELGSRVGVESSGENQRGWIRTLYDRQ